MSKETKRGGNKVLNIMYSNADGLSSKIQELQQEIKINKPDIVCITETKLEEEILDATLNLKGYQVWRRDRKGKKSRGVMILAGINYCFTKSYLKHQGQRQ